MYDPTDTQSELNRKAVEALQMICRWHDEGKASNGEASFAMRVLYTALSGMLRQDLNEILNDQFNELVQESEKPRKVCVLAKSNANKGIDMTMVSLPHNSKVVFIANHNTSKKVETDSIESAKSKYTGLIETFKAKGWTVLAMEGM